MNERFAVHRLNEQGLQKAQKVAEAFDRLLTEVHDLAGDQTYIPFRLHEVGGLLEKACFLTKKEIACQPQNQVES